MFTAEAQQKVADIESVQTGYYRAKVGDTILPNRTTERKAKDDGFNYMAKYGISGTYDILFPDRVKVDVVIPETVTDTIIQEVEVIVRDTTYLDRIEYIDRIIRDTTFVDRIEYVDVIVRDTIIEEVEVIVRDTTFVDRIEYVDVIVRDTIIEEVEVIVRDTTFVDRIEYVDVIVRDTTYVDRIEYVDRIVTDTIYQDVEVIVRDTTYVDRIEYVDRIVRDTIYQDVEVIVRDTIFVSGPFELIITNGYLGPDVSDAFQNNRLKIEYFEGNSGNLENLKSSLATGRVADSIAYITEIKTPQSNPNKDRYGTRVTGYINPPLTGEYIFHCYADDELELRIWINDVPVLLLDQAFYSAQEQWDRYVEVGIQKSVPIQLDANNRYRFEVVTYEGGGGDYFGVGWTKPGDTALELIPQLYLTEYIEN